MPESLNPSPKDLIHVKHDSSPGAGFVSDFASSLIPCRSAERCCCDWPLGKTPSSPGHRLQSWPKLTFAKCTNCRSKKVRLRPRHTQNLQLISSQLRCSREAPACERCVTHGLSCYYPRRRPRAARTRAAGTGDSTLSLILNRLQRIETGQTSRSRRSSTPSTDGPPSLAQAGQTIATPASDLTDADDRTSREVEKSLPSRRPAAREVTSGGATSLDVESMLGETFDRVREKRLRRIVGINAIAVEGVDIPPEKARTWIHSMWPGL